MLPTFLRHRVLFAFCKAMCAPVAALYREFLNVRGNHIFRTAYNGQVCYLLAALNDHFNTTGFEIADGDTVGEWLYAKKEDMVSQLLVVDENLNPPREEGEPPPEHPVPLLADEIRLTMKQDTFVVYVPEFIYATQLPQVRAVVDRFRILSKTPIYSPISNEHSRLPQNSRKRWQWPLPSVSPGS